MASLRPAEAFDQRNLRLRLASALILAPVVLGAVWLGGWAWLLAISVAAALLSIEWGMMSAPTRPARVAAAVLTVVLVAVFLAEFGRWLWAWSVLAVGAAVVAILARGFSERWSDAAFGALYIGTPCVLLLWLRSGPDGIGLAWTLATVLLVWAADGAAYFTGSILKGPKLWPRFSPNKTWSGFFGGLAGAAAAALAHCHVIGPPLPFVWALGLGVLTGAAAMAGDLWESMLKRRFGVKDSGSLIPGHGGLLDRVDGLMFATLAVAAVRFAAMRGWVA